MPATDYAELQGMPSGCTDESVPWQVEALIVNVPYGGVDDGAIAQEPLISIEWPAEKYDMFAGDDVYDLDTEGGLGYQSAYEMEVLTSLRAQASATKNNTAFYHPEAKDSIVALAAEAYDLLVENQQIYKKYEGPAGPVKYKLKKVGDRPAGYGYFPLSTPDAQVWALIDHDEVGLGMSMRDTDRWNIRENYHKAIYLLWCALYGKNQSLSWRENKRIYTEQHPPSQGPGLQAGPGAPPPVPPGGDFPQAWPEPEPEPPTPGRYVTPGGEPPPPGGFNVSPIPTEPPGGEEPGYDEFPPDYEPEPEPPARKKKGGGAGAALVVGVVAVALLASRK